MVDSITFLFCFFKIKEELLEESSKKLTDKEKNANLKTEDDIKTEIKDEPDNSIANSKEKQLMINKDLIKTEEKVLALVKSKINQLTDNCEYFLRVFLVYLKGFNAIFQR